MSWTAERERPVATKGLRILLADESEAKLRKAEATLRGLGHTVTARTVSVEAASEYVASDDPDLSIVVVHDDDSHALELVREMTEFARGPVLLLLDDGGDDDDDSHALIAQAAEQGIYAFARASFESEVQGAIELAMRRHAEYRRLSEQVSQLEGALQRRSAIELAKGILMERHDLDARAAFELLRTQARRSNQRVVDLARAVGEGRALLPRDTDPPD